MTGMAERSEALAIYTIGYGSRSFEAFLSALRATGIEYVIDVRSAPYSRFRPEFNKTELENRLRLHAIRYVYLGDKLGGQPADRDCYVDDKVDYERVKDKPFYREGLARLHKAYGQGLRVVLLCSEGKPEACHRSKLIGASLSELQVPVLHIDENDQLQTQEEVVLAAAGGQLSLFGDPTFTSRKRYRPRDEAAARQEDEDDAD